MNRRRVILWIAVAAAVLLAAYLIWRGLASTQQPLGAVAVRRGAIEATVDALGRVQSAREIDVTSRASGRVERVHVRPGDTVPGGTLLVELDGRDQREALQQAQRSLNLHRLRLEAALSAPSSAQIDIATARLRRATAQRLNAQSEYDEIEGQPDAESSDEAVALEAARLEYEIVSAELDRLLEGPSESELALLRAEVAGAEVVLQQAQSRLEETRVTAPFEGSVVGVVVDEGQNVFALAPLVRLANLDALQIQGEISEIDVAEITEGQAVRIRLDAFAGQVLTGTVQQVLPTALATRGSTTYAAQVAFDAQSLPVRPGMSATLTILTQQKPDALLVPQRAVRRVGRQQLVRVLRGTRVDEVEVVTGLSDESEVEILSGLEEGQLVLVD